MENIMKTLLLPITVALALSSCGTVPETPIAKTSDSTSETVTPDHSTTANTPSNLYRIPQHASATPSVTEQQQDLNILTGQALSTALGIVKRDLCNNVSPIQSSVALALPSASDPKLFTPNSKSMLQDREMDAVSMALAPSGQLALAGFTTHARASVAWFTSTGQPIQLTMLDVDAPFDSTVTHSQFAIDGSLAVVGLAGGSSLRNATGDTIYEQRLEKTFMAKFDKDRKCAWGLEFMQGGTPTKAIAAIAADGSVYVAGSTTGFPGAQVIGQHDGFVLKLSSNGDPVWLRTIGNDGDDIISSMTVDSNGDLDLVGSSTSTSLRGWSATGKGDAMLASLNADGTLRWARLFGSNAEDRATNISANGSDFWVSGSSRGSFGGVQNPTLRDDGVSADLSGFVARVTDSGNVVWAVTARRAGESAQLQFGNDPLSPVNDAVDLQSTCVLPDGRMLLSNSGPYAPRAIAYDMMTGAERGAWKFVSNPEIEPGFRAHSGASDVLCDTNGQAIAFSRANQIGAHYFNMGYSASILTPMNIR
jgi:hypothetical protein